MKNSPHPEFGLGVLAAVGLHVATASRVEGPRLGHAHEVTDPVASFVPAMGLGPAALLRSSTGWKGGSTASLDENAISQGPPAGCAGGVGIADATAPKKYVAGGPAGD